MCVCVYPLVMAISQYPILLRRVKQKTHNVEVNIEFLKSCAFVGTDE